MRFARATIIARDARPWEYVTRREILRAVAIVLALVVMTGVCVVAVPYAVAREALTYGDPTTIMAGPRDRWFFTEGWSGARRRGQRHDAVCRRTVRRRSESFCPRRARTG